MLQWVLTPSCPEAVLTSRIHGKRVASIVPHENGRVGKEVNLGPLRRCAQLRQTSVEQKSEQALSILCERRGGRGSPAEQEPVSPQLWSQPRRDDRGAECWAQGGLTPGL